MPRKFQHGGCTWELRAGGPPMGCRERTDPPFEAALQIAYPSLARLTPRQIASWVVARLNALTDGSLELEGRWFAHDSNEFGYKLRVCDSHKTTLAYGGVVFQAGRTLFAWSGEGLGDFQAAFITLLAEAPSDLVRCEIVVHEPESKRTRSYGWDGHSLITW